MTYMKTSCLQRDSTADMPTLLDHNLKAGGDFNCLV